MSRRASTLLLATVLALTGASCPDAEPDGEPLDTRAADEREEEAAILRRLMVERIEARLGNLDPRVVDVLRRIPRHRFVPGAPLWDAYDWRSPLPIGHGQTISAPEIVALMTSRLELRGDEKVLEIGTGSGYQAAVLAELVPEVFTIEILEGLGRTARKRLESLGYRNVRVRIGDGYRGWPEEAPFDAIIVTAAPPETPPALLEQLAPGGRMIVPVGERNGRQWLTLHEKDADGRITTRTGIPVRFVPMVHEDE